MADVQEGDVGTSKEDRMYLLQMIMKNYEERELSLIHIWSERERETL